MRNSLFWRSGAASVLIATCAAFLALASCARSKEPIRIGVNAWPPCELWYVAQARGFFGDLPVEIVRFSTWTDNMKALPLGNIDLTHSSYFNALYYLGKGAKGRIVQKSDAIEGGDGLALRNGLAGKDLRGKRIAVELRTDEHFLLYKALESFGLREGEVVIVSATSTEAAEFFASGEVEACFTYEPYLSEAAERGKGRIAYSTKDIPDTMIDVLVASDRLIRERPSELRKLIAAYFAAQAWVDENPAEAFALMGSKEGMEAKDFEAFYRSFTRFSAQDSRETFASASFKAKLEEMNAFLKDHGLVPSGQGVEDAVWPKGLGR